mmetsp:Transcript_31902/g.32332  ORF Transcript_31902/g.32332 Transcript_31902/m.32332 type:complete len:96 (-) Transcript_31902:20-307(-)
MIAAFVSAQIPYGPRLVIIAALPFSNNSIAAALPYVAVQSMILYVAALIPYGTKTRNNGCCDNNSSTVVVVSRTQWQSQYRYTEVIHSYLLNTWV